MANVELRQIRKSYTETEIIRGVDLLIRDGELTVFVGPSGCGKSTLLRLIAGLEEISSGELLLDGKRMNDVPPAKRELAMVFQSYALYPHMSVAENMAFSMKLAGVSAAEQQRRVTDAARILHLESLLDRKPKELSGGQRQRVAIGRAIVRNPKVFLFDEPLSNLDAALRVRMRLELTRLHHQLRSTMIYVTHDQVEAMTMADRIVVLQSGMIEQVGSPMELYRSPRNLFVAGFIGSPKMNFLQATVQQASERGVTVALKSGATLEVSGIAPPPLRGSAITIGIRPEHVTLVGTSGISAIVQVVEHLGGESYLHVVTDSDEAMTIRVNGETGAQADEQVQLGFDNRLLHVFDADGNAIRTPATMPITAPVGI